jgi:hypothetical protein
VEFGGTTLLKMNLAILYVDLVLFGTLREDMKVDVDI